METQGIPSKRVRRQLVRYLADFVGFVKRKLYLGSSFYLTTLFPATRIADLPPERQRLILGSAPETYELSFFLMNF